LEARVRSNAFLTAAPRLAAPITSFALLAVSLLLVACGGASAPSVPEGGAGTLLIASSGEQAWALRVLDLTNLERSSRGLAPLVLDAAASAAAYDHCWDMDARDFFDHVNPDGDDPADRLRDHGVELIVAGENIARGQASPEEVVQAWMASPAHRENILYPGWTHIGIGIHAGPERGPWWAQEFYR